MSEEALPGGEAVPRGGEAYTASVAARVARRRAEPSGWWGMVLLIATESALFGALLASYYYLRFRSPTWPPNGVPAPSVVAPAILTAVLVATSIPMQMAARAARDGRRRTAWQLLALAGLVQAAYIVIQLILFGDDLHKFHATTNAYTSVYFTVLGVHHLHVIVGLLLTWFFVVRLFTGLTRYRVTGVRAVTLYWHFINVMAILVVLTQLEPSL